MCKTLTVSHTWGRNPYTKPIYNKVLNSLSNLLNTDLLKMKDTTTVMYVTELTVPNILKDKKKVT